MSWTKPRREPKQITGSIGVRETAPSIGLEEALSALPDVAKPPVRAPRFPIECDVQGGKIRASARGEECDIRIPLACNFDPSTVVWSHFPGLAAGRGIGLKSLDLCGVYACSNCHDIVDMRAPVPYGMTREFVMLCWHEGHLRSLVKLRAKGII